MSAANSSSLGIDIFLFGTSLAFENISSTLQLTLFFFDTSILLLHMRILMHHRIPISGVQPFLFYLNIYTLETDNGIIPLNLPL